MSRMLHHGANPNIKTPTGLSPLHIAAMWGRYQTINVLLDNGAELAVKDQDDMSPLDYAEEAEMNRTQCIDALTRYRLNCKRRLGEFKTKTRVNLNKILGGDVELSTFLSDKQDDVSFDANDDIYALNMTNDEQDLSIMNDTLFQTCTESIANLVSSTMLEGPEPSDSMLTEISELRTGLSKKLLLSLLCITSNGKIKKNAYYSIIISYYFKLPIIFKILNCSEFSS